ncbi:alpha/beta hydrolase fold domain-containing protein [Alloacidobacterium dinghuense]|uniref:Alpha/beta hydrolase fold domain-containing protein n=1 Tax=Alloacidobacterium dinghuense TaxID=2763107 RepID=A0A7G8BJU2_9BACT|nr:alpha/beta hydrolase fold domain-containing protein [Alloacidobacterium dinghuense]QNI32812.1 alpha/beta hydrolase fold domain-containing protein [Alloacidobacterium dinghuense]
MKNIVFSAALLAIVSAASATAQTTAANAPQANASYIDAQGTAHVSRIVPVPKTISPEAQKSLARPDSDAPVAEPLADRRSKTDAWQAKAGEAYREVYPATVSAGTIGGVPVRIVTPPIVGTGKADRVLVNFHGGGFNSDSGSLTESIPIANLTQTKVISVLYRLAPEHPFPASVEDTIAVYKELLKTYKPHNIALYGTSAGAILTAETAVKIKQLGLPMPGALGIFSGLGDFSLAGDSQSMYALRGLSGYLSPPVLEGVHDPEYVGTTNPKDPVLSPLYADLRGMPPTLFVTSGRDLLLSGTTILHRAFLRAGVDAHLVVFEALPHAFWNDVDLPESREADEVMAHFFDTRVGK